MLLAFGFKMLCETLPSRTSSKLLTEGSEATTDVRDEKHAATRADRCGPSAGHRPHINHHLFLATLCLSPLTRGLLPVLPNGTARTLARGCQRVHVEDRAAAWVLVAAARRRMGFAHVPVLAV